jgi:hypothetical protein
MRISRLLVCASVLLLGCGGPFASRARCDLLCLVTRSDSISHTNRQLWGMVRDIDAVSRPSGTLVRDLAATGRRELRDVWGRPIEYAPAGDRFEVRSVGSDGVAGSADDIFLTGLLGRSEPCEYRSEIQHFRVEPNCTEHRPVAVYPLCPALGRSDRVERESPGTAWDSVLWTGRRLVRVARAVDGYGREIGRVPPGLSGAGVWNRDRDGQISDVWGSRVRYTAAEGRFELRSAGPDRAYDTRDDVVVTARLGSEIACEFATEAGPQRCGEEPPACEPYAPASEPSPAGLQTLAPADTAR